MNTAKGITTDMMQAIKGGSVKMLPGLFKRRMDLNEAYLMELDTGCLLPSS